MESQNLFPSSLMSAPLVLFVALSEESLLYAFIAATELRKHGIATDIYPEPSKVQKQMRHANQLGVPFVAIVGDDELQTHSVMLKNMESGEQQSMTVDEVIKSIGQRA
jgi:histidyl-tRNA synthetase